MDSTKSLVDRDAERLASGHYSLGPLCKQGHEWQSTGQSLRREDRRGCVECHRGQARAQHVASRPPDWAEQKAKRQLLPGKWYSQADVERFWSKVDTSGEHWTYRGWHDITGYPMFRLQGKDIRVSHFVWELRYDRRFPEGLFATHTCDMPQCVNPLHIRPGTQAENIADRDRKGRTARGDRSGARLHPESRPRGRDHWMHQHPEWIRRGDDHYYRRHPEQIRRGEDAHNASLTNAQAVAIYLRYQVVKSQRKVAREFGVTRDVVQTIVRGETYQQATAHLRLVGEDAGGPDKRPDERVG